MARLAIYPFGRAKPLANVYRFPRSDAADTIIDGYLFEPASSGGSIIEATGTSAGAASVTGVAAVRLGAVGSATGLATVAGVSAAIKGATGTSAGLSVVSGLSGLLYGTTGAASGVSGVSGAVGYIQGSVGALTGASGASGGAAAIYGTVGNAAGSSIVSGDGGLAIPTIIIEAEGIASGTATVIGIGETVTRPFTIGTAESMGIIPSASVHDIATAIGAHDLTPSLPTQSIAKPVTSFQIARAA